MSLKHKVICVTGAHPWLRQDIRAFIELHGGTLVGSVSFKVDYLVAGERAGSKLDKAKSLGVKVVTLKQLITLATKRDPLEDCYNLANDRARLDWGLRITLKTCGLGSVQIDKIINDVRASDFSSLQKALKI